MKTIQILSQLSLTENGIQTKTKNGRYQPFFFQQGDLDGACVIYSALMSLIIVQAVSYKNVAMGAKIGDGRTRIEKLKKELFESNGMHRDGNYLFHKRYSSLEEKALKVFGKVVTSQKGFGESQQDLLAIKSHLEQNLPVIVSLEFSKNWAHAVLIIGMQVNSDGNPIQFYVLDPSSPLPFGSYWNGVIQLDQGSTKYPDFYFAHSGNTEKCYLADWLVFKKI